MLWFKDLCKGKWLENRKNGRECLFFGYIGIFERNWAWDFDAMGKIREKLCIVTKMC